MAKQDKPTKTKSSELDFKDLDKVAGGMDRNLGVKKQAEASLSDSHDSDFDADLHLSKEGGDTSFEQGARPEALERQAEVWLHDTAMAVSEEKQPEALEKQAEATALEKQAEATALEKQAEADGT